MLRKVLTGFILFLTVFSCSQNEAEIELGAEEASFLNSLELESEAMLDHAFEGLKELNTDQLASGRFDIQEHSIESFLDYAESSELFSPYYEPIQDALRNPQSNFSNREVVVNLFEEETGQAFLNELEFAYILLPDLEAFNSRVSEIEQSIITTITDSDSRMALLTLVKTSVATVNYLISHEQEIIEQYYTLFYGLEFENGRVVQECCFQGELQWSWVDFYGSGLGAAGGLAATTWFLNAIGGVGNVSYGAVVAGGFFGGVTTYTIIQFWNWMYSTGGGGGGSNGDDEDKPDCWLTCLGQDQ